MDWNEAFERLGEAVAGAAWADPAIRTQAVVTFWVEVTRASWARVRAVRDGRSGANDDKRPLSRKLALIRANQLDGRSSVAHAAREFKAGLSADLGGNPSNAQLAVIDVLGRTKMLLDTMDDWIFRQRPVVLVNKKGVHRVVEQRMGMTRDFILGLDKLGLEPRAKAVETLAEFLKKKKDE